MSPEHKVIIQIAVFAIILLIHIAFAEFYPDPPSSDNTLFITFKPEWKLFETNILVDTI